MNYQRYKDDCKRLGHKPTLSEKQFNECMGIETEDIIPPLQVRPKKDAKTIECTHDNYLKVQNGQ